MNGDLMPIGGHRRKYDPKHAKKIREGGKKAQQIAKASAKEHESAEVPKAEEELLEALENIEINKHHD